MWHLIPIITKISVFGSYVIKWNLSSTKGRAFQKMSVEWDVCEISAHPMWKCGVEGHLY
jgi:hypothetical protein